MKTYDFFDSEGELRERKRCSQKEAEILENNFGWRKEEHKRKHEKRQDNFS